MRISDWSSDVCSSDLPASVGLSCKIAAEQIDEIQVGGMGERSATKPAQRQYGKHAARHAAMLRLELPDSRVSQSHQRRLGNPCIIDRYGQWVASSFNDLHPQREATIAHSLPHAVQQNLIILAGDRKSTRLNSSH